MHPLKQLSVLWMVVLSVQYVAICSLILPRLMLF